MISLCKATFIMGIYLMMSSCQSVKNHTQKELLQVSQDLNILSSNQGPCNFLISYSSDNFILECKASTSSQNKVIYYINKNNEIESKTTYQKSVSIWDFENNGQQIVYTSGKSFSESLFRAFPLENNIKAIEKNVYSVGQAQLVTNHDWIIYSISQKGELPRLKAFHSKSAIYLDLSPSNSGDYWPQVSPSADKIAWIRKVGNKKTIMIAQLMIGESSIYFENSQKLSDSSSDYDFPSWNMDGTLLLFSKSIQNETASYELMAFDWQRFCVFSLNLTHNKPIASHLSNDGQWILWREQNNDEHISKIYRTPFAIPRKSCENG